MKIDKKAVGRRLAELRKQKNLTMEEVATSLNLGGKSTVNNWEKGRSFPKKQLNELANLLDTSPEYISYGSVEEYLTELVKTDFQSKDSVLHENLISYFKLFYDYEQATSPGSFKYDENGKLVQVIDKNGVIDVEKTFQAEQVWIEGFTNECLDQFLKDNLTQLKSNVASYNDSENLRLINSYIVGIIATKQRELPVIISQIENYITEKSYLITPSFRFFGAVSDEEITEKINTFLRSKDVSPKKKIEYFYNSKFLSVAENFKDQAEKIAKDYQHALADLSNE